MHAEQITITETELELPRPVAERMYAAFQESISGALEEGYSENVIIMTIMEDFLNAIPEGADPVELVVASVMNTAFMLVEAAKEKK